METPARFTFAPDGNTTVFQIPVTMKGDNYVRIDIDGTTINDRTKFDLVNNAVVFVSSATVPSGSQLDVLVVQTDEGIANLGNVTAIDLVAQNLAIITTVGDNITSVNTTATNIASVNNVSTNMAVVVDAVNQATAAAASAAAALASENDAAASATAAASSASSALVSSISASSSAANASSSDAAAFASKLAAASSATAAATSATNAASSATAAASSATAASGSATSAAASATTATTKASEASTSASSAATSATNAAGSATAAATSASQAATSATNAANSATSASTYAASAAGSATNAATSATSAGGAADAAATSANAAYISETNAAISETNAASSATTAALMATNASNSASSAATSATSAAASASAAAGSATSAQTAADTALAALDSFDDRYLGQKASDPSLDNDGNPLVAGALYFNTTDNIMKVYEGTIWVAAYASLSGALIAANNLSDVVNVASSRTNLGLGETDTPSFAGVQLVGGAGTEGILTWNTADQTADLDVGNGVVYQLGQELGQTVRNLTGSTIYNGTVVRITGASGDKPTVALADNSSESTSSTTFAVATEDFNNNATGRVTTNGLVRGLNTSAFTEGAAIWLGVNGAFTETKPLSPAHLVLIGWVVRSHATEGIILVSISNGWEVEELHDVLLTSVADGQILAYEASSGLWKNTSQSIQNLSDVTTMTPTDGQVLVWNATSGYWEAGTAAAGATGGGTDQIFYENGQIVTTNYTITDGKNAMSAGPITINSGVTVTIGSGEVWTIV